MIKGHDLLHEQISRYLHNLLKKEKLQPGDRLISEREIARMFKTSNRPVRQAMQQFINQGILERIHGKGTFIRRAMDRPLKTGKIGVLFYHSAAGVFQSSFYAPILSGIELQARLADQLLVMGSFSQERDPATLLQRLSDDVDGFLLLDYLPVPFPALAEVLRHVVKPIVLLNYEESLPGIDAVVFDSYEGTRQMVRFLVAQGHNRLAYVQRRQADHPNYINRYQAFCDALDQPDSAPPLPALDIESLEADPAAFRRLLHGPQAPTALVCSDDPIALRIYPLAAQTGVRIPDDLTVTGFDNVSECLQSAPPLTTVHTPLVDMGMQGIRRLTEKIGEAEQGITRQVRIVLPGTIVERGSHRSLAG